MREKLSNINLPFPYPHHSMLRYVCSFWSHRKPCNIDLGDRGVDFVIYIYKRSNTFFHHCLSKVLKKSTKISFLLIKQKRQMLLASNLEDIFLISLSFMTYIMKAVTLFVLGIGH